VSKPPLNQMILTVGTDEGEVRYEIDDDEKEGVYEARKKVREMRDEGQINLEQYREKLHELGQMYGTRV